MITEHPKLAEGLASTPPAAIAALTLAGVSLQDWVLIGTLVWLSLQVGWFIYQRYKDFRNKDK